jgi:hypothetical protein
MPSDPAPTTDPGEGGVIIIKGGSCEIHFNDSVFKHDPSGMEKRKHKCDDLLIKRIVITGNQKFDSKDIPEGFKGEIRIICK